MKDNFVIILRAPKERHTKKKKYYPLRVRGAPTLVVQPKIFLKIVVSSLSNNMKAANQRGFPFVKVKAIKTFFL